MPPHPRLERLCHHLAIRQTARIALAETLRRNRDKFRRPRATWARCLDLPPRARQRSRDATVRTPPPAFPPILASSAARQLPRLETVRLVVRACAMGATIPVWDEIVMGRPRLALFVAEPFDAPALISISLNGGQLVFCGALAFGR